MSEQISKPNSQLEPMLKMIDGNSSSYIDLPDSALTHIVGGVVLKEMSAARQNESRPGVPDIIVTLTDGRNNSTQHKSDKSQTNSVNKSVI